MSTSTKKAPALIAGNETLGVIGAGVMGRTILKGLFDSGVLSREQAWASSRSKETCESATQELGIAVSTDVGSRIPTAGLILICVKPRQIAGVLSSLKAAGLKPGTLLISVLAGTTVAQLESLLGTENPWVRAMPNTPCVVGEGMTAVCAGTHATPEHLAKAQRIFEAVGKCVAVDEGYFNAITALSGSGPAYQFLIMEALADAGVRVGLPRQLALTLVAQTALGAARMVLSTGRHPASLRDDVTTPAGCTIGGLLMLEDGRIRSVLARAVEEATKIAGDLGAAATAQKEKRHG